MRRIDRDGVPSQRRSRGYCLVTNGGHLPPKYTIALAHQIATGEFLHSDHFSGGEESNDFLRHRGFDVVECSCGGGVRDGPIKTEPGLSTRRKLPRAPARHSERCRECKQRVRELLECIYGSCLSNHQFGWPTLLASYAGTSMETALRHVATALEAHRGFGIDEFVKRDALAGCDFWVPDPGFIVEFDESQHFTVPRKLALSVYADEQPLGFSAERWIALCEQHEARDNEPAYRDEQRAWYDTLRDLVPSIEGLQPTVRLYARDLAWCSLDPDSKDDRDCFLGLVHRAPPPPNRTAAAIRSPSVETATTLPVAMVFPEVNQRSSSGVPPSGAESQRPIVPAATDFAGESVGLVLFPEGYIRASDARRAEKLKKLASELNAPLLVGAVDTRADSTGRAWQVLFRFDPDGSQRQVYAKHSTAGAIAFERQDWDPRVMLPTCELGGVTAGATICHDQYLGLFPRYLARRGARLWVNPSFDNVTDIKWSSILRLRAVENRFFALCTLHCDVKRRKTHPFGFAPDGSELMARQAGAEKVRPLSECSEAGNIYIVDLDLAAAGTALDWSKIPSAGKPKRARNGQPRRPVRAALRGDRPAVLGCSGWETICPGSRVETGHGSVYVEVVPGEQILDSAACFRVLDRAREMKGAPIIWNHWERLPTDSERLATLMMGRAIECCAPIVVSDGDGICELVELSNRNKIPARRTMEASGEAIVDVGNAWGLDGAFKMVARHLRPGMRRCALDRYRTLA